MILSVIRQDNDDALTGNMLHLSQKVNILKQRVEDENLGKHTATCIWKEPSNSLDDFPRLTENICGTLHVVYTKLR